MNLFTVIRRRSEGKGRGDVIRAGIGGKSRLFTSDVDGVLEADAFRPIHIPPPGRRDRSEGQIAQEKTAISNRRA